MSHPFEFIGHDYASRNFNDRRQGKHPGYGLEPPSGGNRRPDDIGGTRVPRKPKPKTPMTPAKRVLK